MKRRNLLLLLLLALFSCASVWGQRALEYKDITSGLNVFSGKDNEAGMVFFCPTSIPLTFESSHDKVVDVYLTEEKGDNTVYYIRFQVGRKYRGRKLTVIASGFSPLTFEVELAPKELKQYSLFDPDAAFVYGCYYEYRKRGADYFQQGMYQEAREQYVTAKECSDCPEDSDLDLRIADIDSISSYLQQAEFLTDVLKYDEARDYYLKALLLNPNDKAIQAKRLEAENQYSVDCNRYSNVADAYYSDGEYEKALELYQKVLDLNCFNSVIAARRVGILRRKLSNRQQRATVFTIDYGFKNAPLGISVGKYKNKVAAAYWSLALHPDIFKAIQTKTEEVDQFEIGTTVGVTVKPVSVAPVWLLFGTGVVLNGQFVPDVQEDGSYSNYSGYETSTNDQEEDMVFDTYTSLPLEAGLAGKIFNRLVLKYVFQYRFPLSKDYEDKVNKTKHSVGIGVCF